MEVIEAIKTRRAIRKFKNTPIDDRTLETVIEAARWAPSWKNSQCWRFIVVKDEAIKARLADCLVQVDMGEKIFPNPSGRAVRTAPVVVVACAAMGKSGYNLGKPDADKGDCWYMYDVALAMQNLALAAHSLGLGTVTIGGMDARKAAEILNLPPDYRAITLNPLGYPDQSPEPTPRRELSRSVYYDRYEKKTA